MCDSVQSAATAIVRFGNCDCHPRIHYCGHCLAAGRGAFVINERQPICMKCGTVTAKDVVTVYPEGHNCGKKH